MSIAVTIEDRLAILEKEMAELKKGVAIGAPKNWLEKLSGSFKDDPEFGEILRLGREFRKKMNRDMS